MSGAKQYNLVCGFYNPEKMLLLYRLLTMRERLDREKREYRDRQRQREKGRGRGG